MPTYVEDEKTTVLLLFNHIIARFEIPRAIVTDHGSYFQNKMMVEMSMKLGFRNDNYTSYYPQANGQVEAINKVLKTILQRMVGKAKENWNLQLFSALWAYRTTLKTSIGFTPFQLLYEIEATLPIECEIPSLKLTIELFPNTTIDEERFLYLNKLDENHRYATLANEAHKQRMKYQYDTSFQPHSFNEGDLVLTYD